MSDGTPGEDPGWGSLGRVLLGALAPWVALRRAIGFARLAPTRANLQREDDVLLARGCPHSLYRTFLQTTLGDPPPS